MVVNTMTLRDVCRAKDAMKDARELSGPVTGA